MLKTEKKKKKRKSPADVKQCLLFVESNRSDGHSVWREGVVWEEGHKYNTYLHHKRVDVLQAGTVGDENQA